MGTEALGGSVRLRFVDGKVREAFLRQEYSYRVLCDGCAHELRETDARYWVHELGRYTAHYCPSCAQRNAVQPNVESLVRAALEEHFVGAEFDRFLKRARFYRWLYKKGRLSDHYTTA